MIGFMLSYLLAFLLILGGGREHTDLLDTVSTDAYWQIKHVSPELAQLQKDAGTDPAPASIESLVKDLGSADFGTRDKARQDLERMGPAILPLLKPVADSQDAEVAAVAQELVKKFTERGQERAIRRLMAIRTLGERKQKEALPMLTTLKSSNEIFVAGYARRAIAQINGETLAPEDLSASLAGDLSLLPADAALVGQTTGLAAERITIASLVEKAVASDPNLNLPVPAGAPARARPDARLLIQQASEQLLTVLERVGNVRIDAATVGFNDTEDAVKPDAKEDAAPPSEHGWFALIVRGEFDAGPAISAVQELIGPDAKITRAEKPGDVTIIADKAGEATVLIPNNHEVIFLTAPNEKESLAARETILTALKTGKSTLAENKELADMMKGIDTKSPLWLVSKFTPIMTKEVLDGTIQTMTVETKAVDKGTQFTIKARTVDADKAKTVVETTSAEIKSELDDVKQEAAAMPAMKAVGDMLGSITIVSDRDTATMTGLVPNGMMDAMLGQMPFLEEILRPQPAVNAPVQVVPQDAPPMPATAPAAPQ